MISFSIVPARNLFGASTNTVTPPKPGGLFSPSALVNNAATNSTSGGLFGAPLATSPPTASNGPGLFSAGGGGGLFGSVASAPTTQPLFGGPAFGGNTSGGLFSTSATSPSGGLFGTSTSPGGFGAPPSFGAPAVFGGSTFGVANIASPGAAAAVSVSTTTGAGGLFAS